jgi:hypothetical protein
MSIDQYSTTPANNDLTNYFKTGMRPSAVKNAGWDIMADLAGYMVSLPTAGGTATAFTVSNGRPFGALVPGLLQILNPASANTGPATLAPDGLSAEAISANGAKLAGGEMQPGVPASLKYDGTQWNLLNPLPAGRNAFIDPCCRVNQTGTAPALSTTYGYGGVDLVQCKASGSAVSAGTIAQDSTGVIASAATPYASKVAAATITGAGKVFFRRWVESHDAVAFIGGYGLFSVLVRQDTGSSINAFLTVNAFQNQDSPGTVVPIATGSGSPVSVPTGADTLVTLAIPNMSVAGTVANGFEVILEMDCGAVATKNFYATDWQACLKTLAQKVAVPRFADDLEAAMSWYEQTYAYGVAPGTNTNFSVVQAAAPGTVINNAGFLNLSWRFSAKKRVMPVITLYSKVGTLGKITAAGSDTAAIANADTTQVSPVNNSGSTISAGVTTQFQATADARI